MHEDAARFQEPALRHREERPGHAPGVVAVIGDIGGDGEFRRFVVAEKALQHLVERGAPISREAAQLKPGAQQSADRALVAGPPEMRDAGLHRLDRPEQAREAVAARGKSPGKRLMRRVEPDRQIEDFADRSAPHREERRNGNPLDFVEQAQFFQDGVLGLVGVARIGGLMQRRLDRQRALLERRGGAADAVIAFDDADLAAALGEKSGRRQAAQPRTDDDGVE